MPPEKVFTSRSAASVEVEPLEQLVGAARAASRLGRWCSRPTISRFSRGAQQPVDGGLLGGDADARADGVGVGDDVEAGDAWPCPRSARTSVVRMRMAVVLPAPLWPSRPSTVPGRDVEVEVAQRPEVAEALAEAVGRDAAVGRAPRP